MNPQLETTLAQQQRALLQALFARPGSDGALAAVAELNDCLAAHGPQTARGLAAYQANGHVLAERSLLSVFPVVAALIGHDNFAWLARDLWHRHPPHRGDLAQWGDALPDFLDRSTQLSDTPYLGDVARAEWALHRAAGAPDTPPDMASFARLTQEDPQGLTLMLAPGTAVIASPYPLASLTTAHLYGTPSLADVGQRLREGIAEHAVIWRQGLRPRIAWHDATAHALLTALLAGAALPQAIDAMGHAASTDQNIDFSAWLIAAVTDGLVIGVRDHTGTHLTPNLETIP